MTIEEIRAQIEFLVACLRNIDTAATTRGAAVTDLAERATASALTADEQRQWDEGTAEVARLRGLVERHDEIARLATLPNAVIPGDAGQPAPFQVNGGESRTDPFDTSELRLNTPPSEIRARAISAIESLGDVADEHRAEAVAKLETIGRRDADLARHVLATGSPAYRSAFGKLLSDASWSLTADEARAVQEARAVALSGTAGYAVPFVLDPTIILTSAGSVNPLRQVARVEQIAAKTWHGVTSAGVTAAYADESAEVGDNAPTLAQPTVDAEKAHAFVPFTIEAGEDWTSLEADVRMMIADAKDTLEATKFTLGAGSGSHEPKGIITTLAATTGSKVSPATAETFAAADVYALENALPPRHRRNASWLANRAIYNKVRQLDTSGGSALWERIGAGLPAQLIGYPVYEASDMDDSWNVAATADNYILVLGDFHQFLIVDRIGMSIELVPHLFATANNRPSGQRGFYAHWRSGSGTLNADAFRVLNLATTA